MMMVDNRDGDRADYRKRQQNPGLTIAVTCLSSFRWLLLIILVTLLPQTTNALVNNNCHNSLCRSVPTRNCRGVGGSILRDHGLLQPRISLLRMAASSGPNKNHQDDNEKPKGIRLNKVFKKTHSRREADRLIEAGRVSVNGEKVASKGGFFVVPYVDEVSLDGKIVEGWEEMNFVVANNIQQGKNAKSGTTKSKQANQSNQKTVTNDNTKSKQQPFEYIKYWKPLGVICTTDSSIPGNIIDEIREHDGYDPPHRVYPVGRLDKETTGLILLTSDGRLVNAACRKEHKRSKTYEVMVDPPLGPPGSKHARQVVQKLERGVVISTETVRNGVRKTLTAPTEPCRVEQLNDQWIRLTIKEGRNRQVRKMTQAVGHRTVELERVSFAGIPLEPGLRGPGDWAYLNRSEMKIVNDMIQAAEEAREQDGAYWERD